MKLRLREIRIERQMTQRKIADIIGCTVGAYSKYETGDREPSIEILSALADYYGVSLDYLVGRDFEAEKNLTLFEKNLIASSRRIPGYVNEYLLSFMDFLISKKAPPNK